MSCKGCTRRYVGCHSDCEDYKEEKRLRDERNEQIKNAKDLEEKLNQRAVIRARKAKGAKR